MPDRVVGKGEVVLVRSGQAKAEGAARRGTMAQVGGNVQTRHATWGKKKKGSAVEREQQQRWS